jgi:hypothetical protein
LIPKDGEALGISTWPRCASVSARGEAAWPAELLMADGFEAQSFIVELSLIPKVMTRIIANH